MDDSLTGNTVTVQTTQVQAAENGVTLAQIKQEKPDPNTSTASNTSTKLDANGQPIPSSKLFS